MQLPLPSRRSGAGLLTLAALACTPLHAQGVVRALHGPNGRNLGIALADAGDIDGDGRTDILATSDLPSLVRVYSSADWTIHLQLEDVPEGGAVDRVLGTGDLDGDGTNDFMMASSLWSDLSLGTEGFWRGYVEARSGVDGSLLFRREGTCTGNVLGEDLDVIGDLDQDGRPDVAVCEPYYSPDCSPSLLGRVLVLSGADGSVLQEIVTGFGGNSVAGTGDLDGDGLPDLVVGYPAQSVVRAFRGGSGEGIFAFNGGFGTGAGSTVDSAGDFDGDGREDVLVGTNGRRVYILSGADGSILLDSGTLLGGAGRPTLLGDLNQDGAPDWGLLGGVNLGTELSVFGGASVQREDTLGIWTPADITARRIARIGDVTGDGRPDFLLSDPNSDDCGPQSGSIYVMDGRCVAKRSYCEGGVNSQGQRARISTTSLTSVSDNDFTLLSTGGVGSQPGIFFYGGAEQALPFGPGTLCVAPGSAGIFRLPPVAQSAGVATLALDLAAPLEAEGEILAGSSWYFQFWYRDPLGGGFNLSDALAVTFCP